MRIGQVSIQEAIAGLKNGLATATGCAIQSSRVIFRAQLAERVAGKFQVPPDSFDIFLAIGYYAAGLLNHLLLLADVLQQGSELQLNVGRGRFKRWGRLCEHNAPALIHSCV